MTPSYIRDRQVLYRHFTAATVTFNVHSKHWGKGSCEACVFGKVRKSNVTKQQGDLKEFGQLRESFIDGLFDRFDIGQQWGDLAG